MATIRKLPNGRFRADIRKNYTFIQAKTAKRRAKLSRFLGKRALKSFHPRLFNDRLFAGETWSDKNGSHNRNQAIAFC
ncbi:hypothetical protein [Methylomonas sp. MK1]|uniref:hypothetical protein n=1 Tax=Methylomonas sp. MK1 TaxID=1131552 RepID=UPI001360B2D1|nr:hypothetical protein [Methylomonas sp. MK1]